MTWWGSPKTATEYASKFPESTVISISIKALRIASPSGAWHDGLPDEKRDIEWLRRHKYHGKWYAEEGRLTLGLLPDIALNNLTLKVAAVHTYASRIGKSSDGRFRIGVPVSHTLGLYRDKKGG